MNKYIYILLTPILAITSFSASASIQARVCVAKYPSPTADPEHKDIEARILAFFSGTEIELHKDSGPMISILLSPSEYPKAHAALIAAVKRHEFEPSVLDFPEAWKRRDDGSFFYDTKLADELIKKEI